MLNAYARGPSRKSSRWYMGNLTTYLADRADTNGTFGFMEATLTPGSEPPPHVHSREDELFYVMEGAFDAYVGAEAYRVNTGECIFQPRLIPHAFVIRSPRLRMLALFIPGGIEEIFRELSSPAETLDRPAVGASDGTADLERLGRLFDALGVRVLSPDEIAEQMPLYPQPSVNFR
jgi:quercetin dioxygenase-like cupin family protein